MRDDLQKHTLNLRAGDYHFLDTVYRTRRVSAAEIIRQLVSQHVDMLRQVDPSSNERPQIDLDL